MKIDTGFLKQIDRFQIALKRKINTQYQGNRTTKLGGSGLVFKEFREYIPGDEIRKIDWVLFGKTERLYVKNYEEERNLTLHIILDSSSSMDYGNSISKFEYGSMLGIGFAYMALKNNEKFEFSTFANELEFYKTSKGMNKLANLIVMLNKHKVKGKSKFNESIYPYKNMIKSKALVVIISDFLYSIEELKETLLLFKKSEIVLIQTLDKTELDLELEGDVLLEDAENSSVLKTFLSGRMKELYANRLKKHILQLEGLAEAFDAKFLTINTSMPIFDAFYHLMER